MKQRNVKIFFEGENDKILRNTWSCKPVKEIIKENKDYALEWALKVRWIKVAGKLVFGRFVNAKKGVQENEKRR